ncbi:DUF4296 domain-containing protein [Mesonia sp. HuA40]|uniref:DUF4296 domain-containing protein n=1 Tax=Mesonia sp. HuA40 TaxID=2602761 RepID=UPI0011C7DD5B|nr:DUF4296 domain-containing protein [Mesonia sp. HuA40]TXK71620.1 DUF4296 domain-containing protein [Mesonia sp. HuA40]
MKHLVVLILMLFFVITGCQNIEKVSKPDSLIDEKTMVNLLFDLHYTDAIQGYSGTKFMQRDVKVNKLILKKYNIDSLTFVENANYYFEDAERNEKIYREVLERLEAKKAFNDSLMKKEKEVEKANALP